MAEYRFQKPRKLAERAYLGFYFPEPDNRYSKVILPFFENPIIKEEQKSRLVEYNPLSRSSSLFTYIGATSRQFSINFNITLNHLEFLYENWDKYVNQLKDETKEEKKGKFRKIQFNENVENTKGAIVAKEYNSSLVYLKYSDITNSYRNKVISVINFWTNIVRSSVINNSTNPLYGPPIIRLNFGILYRDVPCICRGYNIEYNEEAGYDVATLLSRKIGFQLSLSEIRVGNFNKYYPGVENSVQHRDNITGWESVINNPYELDPNPLVSND